MVQSRGSRSSHACAIAALFLGVAVAPAARAQTSGDSAAAEGLFEEARTLMAAGKAAEACPKFEESERLDPGSGTLVNLAKCYEETGRLASARSKYLEAAAAARVSGNADRESGAREQAAALAPRVSKLVLSVAPEAQLPGLEITRDGSVVGRAQWGVGIPADEGEHTVAAKAPGHQTWTSVAVVKGEGTSTPVSIPPLTESQPLSRPTTTPQPQTFGTRKTLALVAGGVGVVGVGIGTVFGLKTMSRESEAEKYCGKGSACTDNRGVTAGNDAYSSGNIATIGMVVGAVGLAGGLTLWFTAPKTGSEKEIAVGPGSVQFRRTW